MTLIKSHILDLLKKSKNFTVVAGEPEDDSWLVSSVAGGGIYIDFGINEVSVIGTILAKQAELITMYVYGQIAEKCRLAGCAVGQLVPQADRAAKITISKKVPLKYFSSSTAEIEAELAAVDMAVDSIISYMQKVAKDCLLSNVDISMFEDADIEAFELGEIVQRRYIEFMSWDALIDSVTESTDNEDFRDQMVLQITACKKFEEANPHLVLPEVANHLIVLISESYSDQDISPLDIN